MWLALTSGGNRRDMPELLLCPCAGTPDIGQGRKGLLWLAVLVGSVHWGGDGMVEQSTLHHGPEGGVKGNVSPHPATSPPLFCLSRGMVLVFKVGFPPLSDSSLETPQTHTQGAPHQSLG